MSTVAGEDIANLRPKDRLKLRKRKPFLRKNEKPGR